METPVDAILVTFQPSRLNLSPLSSLVFLLSLIRLRLLRSRLRRGDEEEVREKDVKAGNRARSEVEPRTETVTR